MARILIFGDSITQSLLDSQGGWADRFKRELLAIDKQNSVFNLGISGDNAGHVLARFDQEVQARTKRWDNRENTTVILAVGTNDTYKTGTDSSPKTPLESFIKGYMAIIKKSKVIAKNVVVCAILPVDETRSRSIYREDISYINDTIEEYNKHLERLCVDQEVIFVDLYNATSTVDWNFMLDDGIHPNDQGHQWLCTQIKLVIAELI